MSITVECLECTKTFVEDDDVIEICPHCGNKNKEQTIYRIMDDDQFDCTECGHISDIENSVKVDDDLYCDDCAEQLRRDEKNGLYPDRCDNCN